MNCGRSLGVSGGRSGSPAIALVQPVVKDDPSSATVTATWNEVPSETLAVHVNLLGGTAWLQLTDAMVVVSLFWAAVALP